MDAVQLIPALAPPTAPALPSVDVPQILAALAARLLATPDAHIGTLTVTRAVHDIAGRDVPPVALRPVWDVLPLGGLGNLGHTHAQYAQLLAVAQQSER